MEEATLCPNAANCILFRRYSKAKTGYEMEDPENFLKLDPNRHCEGQALFGICSRYRPATNGLPERRHS